MDVADIIPLHVCDDGLGERARDAVSAMVVSNGDDHHVALGGEWPVWVVLAEFVHSVGHDLAPDVSDDDSSIEVCSGLVVARCNEAGQDLRDLAEPDRGLWPEVEVLERQFVTARGVTEDHRSASPISGTLRRGIHCFGAPVGVAVVVRPLDRLRWGNEAGSASAAERRWMVDHRAMAPYQVSATSWSAERSGSGVFDRGGLRVPFGCRGGRVPSFPRERVRMHPISPQKLANRYTLLERVAVGGMSEVWRARDDVLQRTVAVKILGRQLLGSSEFASRFRAEARHSASLSHPGVASVYDYGEDGERAFLVMEFVDGESLSTLLARTPIPPLTATLSILSQTAEALHAAHSAGITHRDVKPGNIMITPAGVTKVTDFGIARATGAIAVTAVGQVLGTPQYMSPEQAAGREVGPASDVYSLGVVAYEALAGRRPFTESTPLALALAHVNSAPPMLPATVPPGVRAIVERAMSKDPARRQPSAAVLAAELRAQQMRRTPPPAGDSLAPTQPMPLEREAATARHVVLEAGGVVQSRRRAAVVAVVAAAVLASVLLIAFTRRNQSTTLLASTRATGLVSTAKPASTIGAAEPTIVPAASVISATATTAPPTVAPTVAPTTVAPTTQPTISATIVVNPQSYLGRPAADVQRELEALGFTVVQQTGKGKARTGDSVIEVRPAGNLVPGSNITLILGRVKAGD